MPELPEVETVKRVIKPQIMGRRIVSVDVHHPQIIAYPDAESFALNLTGRIITDMKRRGKFLALLFENKDRLILHLRMTGQLLVTPAEHDIEKHTHLIVGLSGGNQLRYIDTRRFGRFWYLKKEESLGMTGADKLGIEPTDKKLTAAYLKERAAGRRIAVKEILLDQSVVAGIGNIYSDEILFAAGINPAAKCCDLTDGNWASLAKMIPETINWAIRKNKITPQQYLEGKGKEYKNTPFLKVYGHAGKPCPRCGSTLERIVIGGRGSTFCFRCQCTAQL